MKSGRHLHNTHTMSVYEEMRPARSDGELRSLLSVRRSELAEINSTARVRVSGTMHRSQLPRRGTTLARYVGGRGRLLRQPELCERHSDWIKANRPNVQALMHEGKRI